MKSTVVKQIKLFLLIFLICFNSGVFFTSCGLETVLNVSEPTVRHNKITYESNDPLTYWNGFETEDKKNDSLEGGDFIGTEVYYRIYSNSSNLNNDVSFIESVNSNTNGDAAARRMISLGYQTLGIYPKRNNSTFAGKHQGSNTNVYFRLKSFSSASSNLPEDLYTMIACIKIGDDDDDYLMDGTNYMVPCRNSGVSSSWRSFDFFDDGNTELDENVKPVQGDIDFQYSESPTSSDEYYVQLYAVSVAMNSETLGDAYSLVLDLGSIPIRKGQ